MDNYFEKLESKVKKYKDKHRAHARKAAVKMACWSFAAAIAPDIAPYRKIF